MRRLVKWALIGLAGLVVLGIAVGGSEEKKAAPQQAAKATPVDTPEPDDEVDADLTPEPDPVVLPEPDGKYELNCDYLLDFDDSLNGNDNHRFVAGGTLENTGNVGIRLRATFKWKLLGQPALVVRKNYKLRRGAERDVNVSVPASSDQIDAHQSADGDCNARVTIVGTFGEARE